MEIKYDTPINVTKAQYLKIINSLKGLVAHRIIDKQHQVKLWDMKQKEYLAFLLR